MKLDGVSTVTAIGIASFAIDRVVTATLFVLSMLHVVGGDDAAGAKKKVDAENRKKFIYYLLSSAMVIAFLVAFPEVGIFSILGLAAQTPASGVLDKVLTFIVLVGGADRISELIKPSEKDSQETTRPRPLEVTGRLILDEPDRKKTAAGS